MSDESAYMHEGYERCVGGIGKGCMNFYWKDKYNYIFIQIFHYYA